MMIFKKCWSVFCTLALLGIALVTPDKVFAQGSTDLISINRTNTGTGDKGSFSPAITPNGRFVAFASDATNLTGIGVSGLDDIFVRDRWIQTTRMVSVNVAGNFGGNGSSQVPVITPNGRYVAFQSSASNLVSNDTNGPNNPDVFVRDLQTNVTTLVSVNNAGSVSGNRGSFHPFISDDGRYVGFYSQASDLVLNDGNELADIFVRDLQTGKTTLVSINRDGTDGGNGDSYILAMTPDGRSLVFGSYARNLTTLDDTNNALDIFVRDTQTNTTRLASVNRLGTAAGNGACEFSPVITPDGHYLVFESLANDLTSISDTNQLYDVFVRNLRAGTTVLVSVNASGSASGNGTSLTPEISADGQRIAFASQARNLVANDNNGLNGDVFVRNMASASTQLVSIDRSGTGSGNGDSYFSLTISAEGRYVAFISRASNLVAIDTPGQNAFVRDLQTQTTRLVSVNAAGTGGANDGVRLPIVTPGGQYIAYVSLASNLVANDGNNAEDVFVFTTSSNTTPIDDARFFVRQHYLDFLNREPDQNGWDYWTSQITQCGNDLLCVHNQRIGVSAAFFIENEFQQTGYVVYRLYRVAYGTLPNATTRANVTFAQFMADRRLLVGGAGLPQSTIDFANGFVQRNEFKQAYPDTMSAAEFVGKLFDTAGIFTDPGPDPRRQQLIDDLNAGRKTRAQVLLEIIEFPDFKPREFNPAFVLMQYFGYLRRNPDQAGYDFWLNVLNSQPNNFRGMVCSFLTSTEYQQRFSSVITRSNSDCQAGPTPSPSPTPNGKIGFLNYEAGSSEIYTMNADGSQRTRLTFDAPNLANVRNFDWSPDGNRIVFEVTGPGRYKLKLINADGSGLRELSTDPLANDIDPDWAPDGSKIVFARDDGIYVINLSDNVVTRLTTGADRRPHWSPDGSRIAYDRDLSAGEAIYVMNADGTDQKNISNAPFYDYFEEWSPNGSRILFIRQVNENSGYDVFTMNADGTDKLNLTNNTPFNNFRARWSPDGSKILFQSNRSGLNQIYVTNTAGTILVRLTNNSAQDGDAAWFRDGTKILFVSDRRLVGSLFDIYLMNSDGSDQLKLSSDGGASSPLWQPRL